MPTFAKNTQVRIKFDMQDADERGDERTTPAGSIGRLDVQTDDLTWSVVFDNGAAGFFSVDELQDSAQCEVLPPPADHQSAGVQPEEIARPQQRPAKRAAP